MTRRTGQPGDPDDPRLREETLLALVEGELSPAREKDVLAALTARPDLLAIVRSMRRDKVVLADLCDLEAPPEVVAGIESALERAALLDAPSFDELPPAPIVLPSRSRSPRWAAGLAMAAAVALLAGGIGYWALSRPPSRAVSPAGPGPIALNKSGAPAAEVARHPPGAAATAESSETAGRTMIADARTHDPGLPAPVPADAVERASSAEIPAALGSPEYVGPMPAQPAVLAGSAITPEIAVELASQGRLAIRVRTGGLASTVETFDAFASQSGDRPWRLNRVFTPEDDAVRTGLGHLAEADAGRAEAREFRSAVAADSGMGSVRVREARAEREAASGPRPYFASLALTPSSLAALRAALESAGTTVTFEKLPGPSRPDVEIRDTDPLWWDEPPSRWVPWADVLVVVEE